MRDRIALLFLLCLPLASYAGAEPIQKSFSDWLVTCNNQSFCSARNIGQHQGLVMALTRSTGARQESGLRIESTTPATGALAPLLLLDGERLKLNSGRWQITGHYLATEDSMAINGLLEKIGDGEAITRSDSPGKISLRGLKAALRFINERQQRPDNKSAWGKPGQSLSLEVTSEPSGAAIPEPFTAGELNDLLDYGAWLANNSPCSLDPLRREVRVYSLSGERALVIANCEAGAYNQVDLAWLVSRKTPFSTRALQLTLPFTPASGDKQLELINIAYDEQTNQLTTLMKGRSAGDCGVATSWRYDGQRFRLEFYAEEPACDGWHGAGAWPTLWLSRPPQRG